MRTRTFGKILEYVLIAILTGSGAYVLATTVSQGVSASFNHMAECLENPTHGCKEN